MSSGKPHSRETQVGKEVKRNSKRKCRGLAYVIIVPSIPSVQASSDRGYESEDSVAWERFDRESPGTVLGSERLSAMILLYHSRIVPSGKKPSTRHQGVERCRKRVRSSMVASNHRSNPVENCQQCAKEACSQKELLLNLTDE